MSDAAEAKVSLSLVDKSELHVHVGEPLTLQIYMYIQTESLNGENPMALLERLFVLAVYCERVHTLYTFMCMCAWVRICDRICENPIF